jgi:AcrR family transcriptional regulator
MATKSEQNPVNSKRFTVREPILDAAERVIAEIGAGHLTLDAVAREAGISKGGLLYHFPNKDELLTALMARYVARCMEAAPAHGDGQSGGDLIKSLTRFRITSHSANKRIAHGMIAALAENPAMVRPLRAYYDELWARLKSETLKPERALLPWLAIEGLLFHELFNTSPLSDTERAKLIEEILGLLEPAQ